MTFISSLDMTYIGSLDMSHNISSLYASRERRKSCTLLLIAISTVAVHWIYVGESSILEISVHWICTHALVRFTCSHTHPEASMQVSEVGAYTRTNDPSHGFELEYFLSRPGGCTVLEKRLAQPRLMEKRRG